MTRTRLGVFGGTFYLPHIAYLVMALEVRDVLSLDIVLMVVAGEPWQKVGAVELSPPADRMAMMEAAVAGVDGLVASDLEVQRPGPSYSADTISELRRRDPDAELFLVLGADAAAGLDTWERADDLAASCQIVVVDRPGVEAPVPGGFRVQRVEAPRLDISSTQLRARASRGKSLRYLVPDPVISVIEAGGLYSERR